MVGIPQAGNSTGGMPVAVMKEDIFVTCAKENPPIKFLND